MDFMSTSGSEKDVKFEGIDYISFVLNSDGLDSISPSHEEGLIRSLINQEITPEQINKQNIYYAEQVLTNAIVKYGYMRLLHVIILCGGDPEKKDENGQNVFTLLDYASKRSKKKDYHYCHCIDGESLRKSLLKFPSDEAFRLCEKCDCCYCRYLVQLKNDGEGKFFLPVLDFASSRSMEPRISAISSVISYHNPKRFKTKKVKKLGTAPQDTAMERDILKGARFAIKQFYGSSYEGNGENWDVPLDGDDFHTLTCSEEGCCEKIHHKKEGMDILERVATKTSQHFSSTKWQNQRITAICCAAAKLWTEELLPMINNGDFMEIEDDPEGHKKILTEEFEVILQEFVNAHGINPFDGKLFT